MSQVFIHDRLKYVFGHCRSWSHFTVSVSEFDDKSCMTFAVILHGVILQRVVQPLLARETELL